MGLTAGNEKAPAERLGTTACRHEKYETQFRAMFVSNCKVERGERLRIPAQGGGKVRNHRRLTLRSC